MSQTSLMLFTLLEQLWSPVQRRPLSTAVFLALMKNQRLLIVGLDPVIFIRFVTLTGGNTSQRLQWSPDSHGEADSDYVFWWGLFWSAGPNQHFASASFSWYLLKLFDFLHHFMSTYTCKCESLFYEGGLIIFKRAGLQLRSHESQ